MKSQHKQLKQVTITINEDIKRFSHIKQLNPIPTNCIIDKTLPGIGATYSEIRELRNSILILPNVATILSKHEQHQKDDYTFAVHEGITKKDLQKYLNLKIPFKKILTTPEGFIGKVKPVLGEVMYTDYFLLLDECHKYITDAGYRKDIVLPMEDFFLFINKAMISATPMIPSDLRFQKQGFILYKVQPDYDYRRDIRVAKTYNTLQQLLTTINEQPSECYCVFFNSIQGITSALEGMSKVLSTNEVIDNYHIFCSKESASELKLKGYKHASMELTTLAKYNFFTSSFYNGMDIYYQGQDATVIIISDAKYAAHTAVNPSVDVVQIRGRFRPWEFMSLERESFSIDWVKSFNHIVRTNREMPALSRVDAELKIAESKLLYDHINTFRLSATLSLTQEDMQAVLDRVSPYSKLIDKEGKLNSYKMDNYLLEEQVKEWYTKFNNLKEAYIESKRFTLTFEQAAEFQKSLEGLNYGKGKYSDRNYLDVTNLLWELEAQPGYWPNQLMLRELWQHFELIVKAYFTIGIEAIDQLGFQHRYIQTAVRLVDSEEGRNKFPVIDEVHAAFKVGEVYKGAIIKQKLQEIFDLFGIPKKADGSEINRYFEARECQQNRKPAFQIHRRRHTNAYERI